MMNLSPQELEILTDKAFMPLKFQVCLKIEDLLAELKPKLTEVNKPSLPEAIRQSTGKLSRGENYKTYAYRLLDHPAHFNKDDFFSFRTMMLWGHEFGFHLLLSGSYKTELLPRILRQQAEIPESWQVLIDEDPWQWESQLSAFQPLASITDQEIIKKLPVIHISKFLPLTDYNSLHEQGIQAWKFWQDLLF